MVKIKFFMNMAPHYRAPLWNILLNNPNWDTHFFYGNCSKGLKAIDFETQEFII